MAEKDLRVGICHSVYRHTKANNKYIKDYNLNVESSYLMYWDVSELYGWSVSKKLPVDGFKWIEKKSSFTLKFIQSYNDNSDKKEYILEVDVSFQKINSDLRFLCFRMKINNCQKLVCNLHYKENYVVHIKALKLALYYRLRWFAWLI